MSVPSEIRERIRLFSDGDLYERARAFFAGRQPIHSTQLSGLLQYAQDWTDLKSFVAKQRERDWSQSGRTRHYRQYYDDLSAELQRIENDAARLVPDGPSRREQQAQISAYAGLLAREYVQHLVAEGTFVGTLPENERARLATGGRAEERRGV